MHPAGTFLYVATYDGLSTYAVNPTSGALTKVGTLPGYHGVVALIRPEALRMRWPRSERRHWSRLRLCERNGVLTPIVGSPFAGASGGGAVTIDPTG